MSRPALKLGHAVNVDDASVLAWDRPKVCPNDTRLKKPERKPLTASCLGITNAEARPLIRYSSVDRLFLLPGLLRECVACRFQSADS